MTTPTNKPVPSQDPRDLLFNAEKVDEAVNSSNMQYLDRFGVARQTLAGAVDSIKAVNVRGAWATATAYQSKDVVSNAGTWYICVAPHTSGATFAGDLAANWRVYQGVVASDLISTSDATKGDALTGVKRTDANAAGMTLHDWIESRTHTLEEFGAVGDNATDDTAAFVRACAALQAAGGGTLRGKKGKTYKLTATAGAAIAAFSNCNGITIDFRDSLINEDKTYTGTQQAQLFTFTGCQNVDVTVRVTSQVAVTTSATNTRGLIAVQLLQGCKNIDLDIDMTGGLAGLMCTKAAADPSSYVSRQIRGSVRATGCYYPYVGQFSGDAVDLRIDTDTCGRSFFIYGATDNKLDVRSTNQQITSLIKAYNGYGCRDVQVRFVDRDSTANQPAAPRLALEWGDSTPATHSGIDIYMDVKNPASSPWGNTFEFAKYSDGATAADSTGRNHLLDGFRLSGLMEQVAGVANVVMVYGALAGSDVVRNFSLRDLTARGASAPLSLSPLAVLSGRAVLENVHCEHNIYATNGAAGEVLFLGCTAANFSNATADTDTHTLIDCVATDGSTQSIINKTFLHTSVGSLTRDDYVQSGRYRCANSKQRIGDQTGTANIFKIPAIGTGAWFRLHYHLVYDQSDFNPASRRETAGTKSWSATISGAGVWNVDIPVGNDVSERTLNASPAVLSVTLTNGDATGGFVTVAATNYNQANSRGTFVLEVIPMSTSCTVIPQ